MLTVFRAPGDYIHNVPMDPTTGYHFCLETPKINQKYRFLSKLKDSDHKNVQLLRIHS